MLKSILTDDPAVQVDKIVDVKTPENRPGESTNTDYLQIGGDTHVVIWNRGPCESFYSSDGSDSCDECGCSAASHPS